MPEMKRIDLYCEDNAHEQFIRALILRLLDEERVDAEIYVRGARGGHIRMMAEFQEYQEAIQQQRYGLIAPDLLVITRDANCERYVKAQQAIKEKVNNNVFRTYAIACPDPHIERWYIADPGSFSSIIGCDPKLGKRKCQRGYYKKKLLDAIRKGGHPAPLRGIEFAKEIVGAMDFYRAGKNEPSLRHFIDAFKGALRT